MVGLKLTDFGWLVCGVVVIQAIYILVAGNEGCFVYIGSIRSHKHHIMT